MSREEVERRIKEDVLGDYEKYGYGRLAVVLKETDAFIGFTGLKFLSDLNQVDLGYRFKSKYWSKGYATEASKAVLALGFEKLKMEEIIAMVLPENQRSIHVLQKLGFHHHKDILEDGELARLFCLTREQYLQNKEEK